ncbi:Uncharacterized protein APZ42_001522, partial [Daphnia magna]
RLKLYIPRKQETTEEEEILQNLPENVETQRRPTIHQRRPGRPKHFCNKKPAATWKRWTSRQWNKTKKITASFWIGSYDTAYSQETILITPLECWWMVNDKKCGDNDMQVGPTGLTFTATPTGEGKCKSAIRKRTQASTRLRDQKILLEMIDAPREEIRRYIIKKFGLATWNYHPKEEFLNQKFNGKTLLHTSVKVGKLDISDLMLDYGADPDIEEDGQIIAHTAAAENNKLLIRILRYHKYKFAAYNSLGETPLMVAIAYGHEDVANYLWISSNVVKMAKDNSTVLHYAAKH